MSLIDSIQLNAIGAVPDSCRLKNRCGRSSTVFFVHSMFLFAIVIAVVTVTGT